MFKGVHVKRNRYGRDLIFARPIFTSLAARDYTHFLLVSCLATMAAFLIVQVECFENFVRGGGGKNGRVHAASALADNIWLNKEAVS